MKLIHHSPLGALEIPEVLGAVEPGVPFEVPDDIGANLLEQVDLYQLAPSPYEGVKVAELKKIAADRGIDLGAASKRDDILAVIVAADAEEASA